MLLTQEYSYLIELHYGCKNLNKTGEGIIKLLSDWWNTFWTTPITNRLLINAGPAGSTSTGSAAQVAHVTPGSEPPSVAQPYGLNNYSAGRLAEDWKRWRQLMETACYSLGACPWRWRWCARLVFGTVIVGRRVNHLGRLCNQPPRSTQPGHPTISRRNQYQRKLERKQAHHAMH